jgi:hypothetical protein
MTVLDVGNTGDEGKIAVLEEEDTVPAGTAALELRAEGPSEGRDTTTELDPPTKPPPTLLELVPVVAIVELADFAADEDITGVEEAGGGTIIELTGGITALELAGGDAGLELAGGITALELAGGGTTFELTGGTTAPELAGGGATFELTGATIALELAGGGATFELAGGDMGLEFAGGGGFELGAETSLELVGVMTDETGGGA